MAAAFPTEVVSGAESVADPTASALEDGAGGEGGVSGFRAVMAVLYLAVCVVGLGGNGLVLAATLKLDRLRSAATVYIFNLALADGLFMAGLPFVAVQNFRDAWPFGDAACKAVMALDGVNQFTSVFCLTAMSVDRYAALGRGPGAGLGAWRTPRRAKAVAAGLWLLSLVPVLPVALHFSAASGLCTLDPSSGSQAWWAGFLACSFVLGFAAPFAVMIAAYTALLLALRRGGRGCRRRGDTPESQRRERQVTRMVVAVVVAFAVCWLPFYALNFCALRRGGAGEGPAFARAFELAVLLSYSWSCANPILYACLSQTFRAHFRALLCPKSLPRPPPANAAVTEAYDLHDSSDGGSQV